MTRFATLTFARAVAAPPDLVWQVWTDPAARAEWAPPAPGVTVEFLTADTSPGGREVSICRAWGQPDIRCEVGWIAVDPLRSVNTESISSGGALLSVALITAEAMPEGAGTKLTVTVQLTSLVGDMEAGYRAGFPAGMANLSALAERRARQASEQ
jgi:uncharacterized protein YndB with AHSA1/START domain